MYYFRKYKNMIEKADIEVHIANEDAIMVSPYTYEAARKILEVYCNNDAQWPIFSTEKIFIENVKQGQKPIVVILTSPISHEKQHYLFLADELNNIELYNAEGDLVTGGWDYLLVYSVYSSRIKDFNFGGFSKISENHPDWWIDNYTVKIPEGISEIKTEGIDISYANKIIIPSSIKKLNWGSFIFNIDKDILFEYDGSFEELKNIISEWPEIYKEVVYYNVRCNDISYTAGLPTECWDGDNETINIPTNSNSQYIKIPNAKGFHWKNIYFPHDFPEVTFLEKEISPQAFESEQEARIAQEGDVLKYTFSKVSSIIYDGTMDEWQERLGNINTSSTDLLNIPVKCSDGTFYFYKTNRLKNVDDIYLRSPIIPSMAYHGTSFRSIRISKDVKSIKAGAFKNAQIDQISYEGTIEEYKSLFSYEDADEKALQPLICGNVTCLDGRLKCGISLDYWSEDETSVKFTEDHLKYGQFKNCRDLKHIELNENIRFISRECFVNCKALKEIDLPKQVAYIRSSAFWNSGLTEAIFPNVKSLGKEVFMNCGNLSVVDLSNIETLDLEVFAIDKIDKLIISPTIEKVLLKSQDYLSNVRCIEYKGTKKSISNILNGNILIRHINLKTLN